MVDARNYLVLGLVMVIFSLAACGGGGGGSGANNPAGESDLITGLNDPPNSDTSPTAAPDPEPNPTGSFLFYKGSGISALDPAAPGAPVQLQSSSRSGGEFLIYQGIYDSSTKTVRDLMPHSAIWAGDAGTNSAFRYDGLIYRASAKTPQEGRSQVISFEEGFTFRHPVGGRRSSDYCDAQVVVDWANPDNTQFFYSLAGSDLKCGLSSNSPTYMVRSGSDAGTPPRLVPDFFTGPLRETETGAISGWLAIQGGNRLYLTTPDFETVSEVQTSAPGWGRILAPFHDFSRYLLYYYESSELVFAEYDCAGNRISDPVFRIQPLSSYSPHIYAYQNDDTDLYVAVDNGDEGSILRISLSDQGFGAVQEMAHETDGRFVGVFQMSENALFYEWESQGTTNLRVVAKTAAGSEPGISIAAPESVTDPDPTLKPALFYNSRNGGTRYASIISDNGAYIARFENAQWVGSVYPRQINLKADTPPSAWILATGVSDTGNYASATLHVYHMQSQSVDVELGVLEGDNITQLGLNRSIGPDVLAIGYMSKDSSMMGDLYLFNIDTAGSLVRLTDTPDLSEGLFSAGR